ncbi:MAG: restriction endonuclease subunit S [Pseudomonadota bacterium]
MELLEKHFDTAFAAPDGVKKLRELILTLAMQGKLVEQDPNDQPASELLKKIEAEKTRLVKEGKIKKPKPLPEIKANELPYSLPDGWKWVRLGEIGLINPRNDAGDSELAGFVPMPLIPEGYSEHHKFEEREWGEIKKGYTHFAEGDVGMAKITPCFENAKSCVFSGLPNGIGAGTTELHIFRNSFNSVIPRFLLCYLKNPNYIAKAVPNMTGSAGQKRVPTPYFKEQLFPLPPLKEQDRIVAKIDQLMARCDELEKLRMDKEQMRLDVHTAALRKLLDSQEQNSFADAWGFLTKHFGDLYSVKENVAELRKAILQLAVMGKLVEQDPNDQPASELLKEIEAEKARLVKEKKIKKPKALPKIKDDEIPYDLPNGWEWVRFFTLGTVKSELVSALDHPTEQQIAPDIIEKGTGRLVGKRTVEEAGTKGPNNKFYAGQLLYSKIRPSLNKAVIAPYDGLCSADMYPIIPHVDPEYTIKAILSEPFLVQVRKEENRVKMPKLNLQSLGNIIVPLPPLSEQHRIVIKVDQLMTLCDDLEQKIDAKTSTQTKLLNAVMAQV